MICSRRTPLQGRPGRLWAGRLVWWLIAVTCVVDAGAAPPSKLSRLLSNSRHAVKVENPDLEADLPQPDPMPAALSPQAPLAPDAGTTQPTVHFVGPSSRRGIDVSHYQGKIDWKQVVRSEEACYVYVKATEGSGLVDNTFRTNLKGARAAGLPVGIYHFFSPTASVEQQFNNLKSNVQLSDMDLIPIIDVEHRGKASHAVFCARLRQFLDLVERHYGVQPMIYTGQNFYNKYLSGTFSKYRYMIAKYDADIPNLIDDARFLIWQYSATGRIPGIRGNVDRSCFMDNYELKDILMPTR